jgi:glycosyltransferase involved in cell wall biosynthesis
MSWSLTDLPPPPPGRTGWPWTTRCSSDAARHLNAEDLPIITIVTPSYNQGIYIEETIRSVLLQGYDRLVYIVKDADSTDGTREILEKYEKFCTRIIVEKDNGQSDAINQVLMSAQGSIGSWLNSDDVLLPGALSAVAREWHVGKPLSIIGRSEYRRKDGIDCFYSVVDVPASPSELLAYGLGRFVGQPSAFFALDAFRRVGGLDLDLHYAMDLDLWFRLYTLSEPRLIPEKLSWMRAHPAAKTSSGSERVLGEVERVFDRHVAGWRTKFPVEFKSIWERRIRERLQRSGELMAAGDIIAGLAMAASSLALGPAQATLIGSSLALSHLKRRFRSLAASGLQ